MRVGEKDHPMTVPMYSDHYTDPYTAQVGGLILMQVAVNPQPGLTPLPPTHNPLSCDISPEEVGHASSIIP